MRIRLFSAYNTPPSLPPSKCVHVSSILVERYCQFNSTYGRLWSSDGVAVCCASVWDIDGLFNNRLLQIEHQLVVVQRSCCAVRVVVILYYYTRDERRSVSCIHLGQEKQKKRVRRNIRTTRKKKREKKRKRCCCSKRRGVHHLGGTGLAQNWKKGKTLALMPLIKTIYRREQKKKNLFLSFFFSRWHAMARLSCW